MYIVVKCLQNVAKSYKRYRIIRKYVLYTDIKKLVRHNI